MQKIVYTVSINADKIDKVSVLSTESAGKGKVTIWRMGLRDRR